MARDSAMGVMGLDPTLPSKMATSRNYMYINTVKTAFKWSTNHRKFKYEVFMFTHYEDMKATKNAKIGVVWGLGSPKVIRHIAI